jgi:hypothetical protein
LVRRTPEPFREQLQVANTTAAEPPSQNLRKARLYSGADFVLGHAKGLGPTGAPSNEPLAA